MKLSLFLKSTVKPGLKISLISFFLLKNLACSPLPSYTFDDAAQMLEKICYQEFQIEVKSWLVDETLWVYVPLEKALTSEGDYAPEFTEKIPWVFNAIERIVLNMDKPPDFFSLVFSDRDYAGMFFYYVGFVPDRVKFAVGLISLQEIEERTVFLPLQKNQVIKDEEGNILRYNLTIGEFIGYLTRQALINKYAYANQNQAIRAREIDSFFTYGNLKISFDIALDENNNSLAQPFAKTKKTLKKYLEIYDYPEEISKIEIIDTAMGRKGVYTQKELLDSF